MRPRHIEIQVFGDEHGGAVHLYERDCSIQRRHQKVIEEAPSPAVDDATRAKMGEVAVRAAKSVGYVGAGTCELLYDGASRGFYFLEMNTRLQVEHPVTEIVTGVDLVRWQLAVAQGEPLPLAQEAIPRRGAAIECRVYAEDPVKFLPSPGTITSLRVPAGPGVRDDSGVTEGSVISVHYDPMISKLCAWADTREAAIDRMRRALAEYHVGGIRTNLPFHRRVMRHPAFIAGEYDTGFIERHKAELAPAAPDEETATLAAVVAAAHAQAHGGASARPARTSILRRPRSRRGEGTRLRMTPVSPVLAAVAAGLVGCATTGGGAWDASGYTQQVYGWNAAYPAGQQALLGPEWQLDNWKKGDRRNASQEKTGGRYSAMSAEDEDGDGRRLCASEQKEVVLYDSKFLNARDNGVIWIQTRPVSPRRTSGAILDVLVENYADSLVGSGLYEQGTLFGTAKAMARSFTTFVKDKTATKLGPHRAVAALD